MPQSQPLVGGHPVLCWLRIRSSSEDFGRVNAYHYVHINSIPSADVHAKEAANSHFNSDPHAYANGDRNTHIHAKPNAHTYPDEDADKHSQPNSQPHAQTHSYSNCSGAEHRCTDSYADPSSADRYS